MTVYAIPFLLERGHSAALRRVRRRPDRRLADPRPPAVRAARRAAAAPGRDRERVRADRGRHRAASSASHSTVAVARRTRAARHGQRHGHARARDRDRRPLRRRAPTARSRASPASMTTAARAAGPFAAAALRRGRRLHGAAVDAVGARRGRRPARVPRRANGDESAQPGGQLVQRARNDVVVRPQAAPLGTRDPRLAHHVHKLQPDRVAQHLGAPPSAARARARRPGRPPNHSTPRWPQQRAWTRRAHAPGFCARRRASPREARARRPSLHSRSLRAPTAHGDLGHCRFQPTAVAHRNVPQFDVGDSFR